MGVPLPNSYTVLPNIIPGNVSIGGTLTISGDTLRLGSAPPFVRLQRRDANFGLVSFNWDRIAVASDVAGSGSASWGMIASAAQALNMDLAVAGNPAGGATLAQMLQSQFSLIQDLMVMGGALPFVRLVRRIAAGLQLTFNLQGDLATRDDLTRQAHGFQTLDGDMTFRRVFMTPGGVVTLDQIGGVSQVAVDPVTVTGTVAETIANSITVRGNVMGVRGGLRYLYILANTAQGGVATIIRARFGGIAGVGLAVNNAVAGQTVILLGVVVNVGATNSQRHSGIQISGPTANALDAGGVIDTTLDQTQVCTVQPGALTDSWTLRVAQVESFQPRAVI